ncbi:MAG: polysaccharide deacetylase family protein [Clostridia bacterium]|nr:polysaccharide deacetylase family protein [Clostridia bacterium]
MKKTICLIVTIFLFSAFPLARAESWYFVSEGKNERPRLPSVQNSSAKGIGQNEKVLYLTFDAGYENGNVKKTVDILKENGVTGAFFVLKHFIEENPDLCREIKDNGNLLCNHTSSHPAITSVSKERLENEIRGLEECCREKTGLELDRFFRPPEGTWSEEALKTVEDMGYKTVFWSLAWADWDNSNQKSAEYALNKLLPRIHDGAVILLHPTSQTNTEILGEIITRMKAEGYRFASLEELWESAES